MVLIDTNVLSGLTKAVPSPVVLAWFDRTSAQHMFINEATVCEIELGLALMPADKRREALYAALQGLITEEFGQRCLPLDAKAACFYGSIAARQKLSGHAGSVEDELITAIELAHLYILVTRNT